MVTLFILLFSSVMGCAHLWRLDQSDVIVDGSAVMVWYVHVHVVRRACSKAKRKHEGQQL